MRSRDSDDVRIVESCARGYPGTPERDPSSNRLSPGYAWPSKELLIDDEFEPSRNADVIRKSTGGIQEDSHVCVVRTNESGDPC